MCDYFWNKTDISVQKKNLGRVSFSLYESKDEKQELWCQLKREAEHLFPVVDIHHSLSLWNTNDSGPKSSELKKFWIIIPKLLSLSLYSIDENTSQKSIT